jgi:predicted transcriptional regulator
MTNIELKKKLINKIEHLEDGYILEEVLHLLEFEESTKVYKLNNAQKLAVDQGRNQIASGQYHTNEQVEKEMDEWLKE